MSNSHPWFKFYPSDWRADQTLRLCSAAARGLWVECMCLMHEAKPYGHLLVNGRRVTDTQLANLTGIPQDQLSALLAELENSGVYSKTSEGVIYSRRMTRDAKRSADGSRHGKKGGNPALTHNPTLNPTLKGQHGGHPPPRSQSPEPRDSSKRVLSDFSRSLSGRREPSAEEKKAIWLSNVCKEAQARLSDGEYAKWLDSYSNGEPEAKRYAEALSKIIKSRRAA